MRVVLIFGPPFAKKERAGSFTIRPRAEAATVGDTIRLIIEFFAVESWFPAGLRPADVELHRVDGKDLVHINRRQPALSFQKQSGEPDQRISVVVSRKAALPSGGSSLRRGPSCGKDKPRGDFARRKRSDTSKPCKGCTSHAKEISKRPSSMSETQSNISLMVVVHVTPSKKR